VKLRGPAKVDWAFVFSCVAHNLPRLPRLIAQKLAALPGSAVCLKNENSSKTGLFEAAPAHTTQVHKPPETQSSCL
jgi:hypothetical protein